MKKTVYFDHAATGYPKPQVVLDAVSEAFIKSGGNPGRSGHHLSLSADNQIYKCREAISELFDFKYPERVIFTQNATHALNIAIQGCIKPNCNVLISNLEHNSVIRPVYALMKSSNKNIKYSFFNAACESDEQIIENFINALYSDIKYVVLTLASNVCGRILPVCEIGKICRQRGIFLIVDGAQAGGIIPINFEKLNADILCMPGHKGLQGPTGTGFLLLGENVNPECLMQGGNGIRSKELGMSQVFPEKLESGTLNTIGICGLSAGISYLREKGIEQLSKQASEICEYVASELRKMTDIKIYGDFKKKVPVILFNKTHRLPEEVTQMFDEKGICTRGGLHCSPIAHLALKSGHSGGVRISFSHTNTQKEADYFLDIIRKI